MRYVGNPPTDSIENFPLCAAAWDWFKFKVNRI